MERRKFVLGMGALAAGGAAGLGTGAFSAMTAERDAYIDVVNDADGLVALTPGDAGGRVYEGEDGQLAIDFTSDEGGSGVNVNSQYQVGSLHHTQASSFSKSDAWIDTHSSTMSAWGYAFSITNQDTTTHDLTLAYDVNQEEIEGYVGFAVSQDWGPYRELEVFDTQTEDSIEFPSVEPGDSVYVSIIVDTRDVEDYESEDLSGTLSISAD